MEDTEWTDALKKHGIIKDEPKQVEEVEEPTPDPIPKFQSAEEEEAWLDENDNGDDDEFIQQYRAKRMLEMLEASKQACFGDLVEITGADYVQQINKAGDGIWVVLLLYRQSHPISGQMQQIFAQLAVKFKQTKFLKSISTLCVANFPDENLPAVFVYHSGQMVKQLIGPAIFGASQITADEVEWILSRTGAITTTLQEDPRKQMHARKFYQQYDSGSEEEEE